MKKLILALGILMISACATTEPKETIIYVDKPVPFYIVPYPSDIAKPDFEIDKIDKNNYAPGQIAKAYRITIQQYKQYTNLLVEVIDKYRELAEKSKQKLTDLETSVDGMQSAGNPMVPKESFVESNLQHMLELYSTEEEFKELEKKSQTQKVDIE
jgi:anion-transporting  ArsA/GET3 family ATPase